MSSQGVPHLANQPHPLLHGTDSKNRPSHTSVCGGLFYCPEKTEQTEYCPNNGTVFLKLRAILGQKKYNYYVFVKNIKPRKRLKIRITYFTKTYKNRFEPCHLDHETHSNEWVSLFSRANQGQNVYSRKCKSWMFTASDVRFCSPLTTFL